jgi:hypothetical protein
MKLIRNEEYTFKRQYAPQGESVEAVFTDEAGEYIVEKHGIAGKAFEFRLAIKRADGKLFRSWRILQDIKNQTVGADRSAIEIYPPESEVTDTANIYHLWVFREGYGPGVSLTKPE